MKRIRLLVIFFIFVIAACGTNSPTANRMYVKVVDGQGNGIANATVVIGSQDGLPVSALSTDNLGEAYFDAFLPNATVTAAFSCYDSSADRTYYYVDIAYDVNISAIALTLGTCDLNTNRVDINVTDEVAGITYREVTLGPITYSTESGTNITMDVYELQDDGKISVFATGYDDEDNIKGYGFALDQPAVEGSVIAFAIDRTDIVRHTHHFGNVPLNAVSYYSYASLLRKHAMTNLPFNFAVGTTPLPDTVTTYSASSFSDNNMYGAAVNLDQDSDGNDDATVGLIRYLRNASDQFFDFNLSPVVPGNLTFTPGVAGRPIISWSNNDPGSTVQNISFSYSTTVPQKTYSYYKMTVPSSATGLVFPELPDILTAFRPVAYGYLSLGSMKFDTPTSYDDYLKAVAYYNGRFYEADGLSSYGYAQITRVP
jgi:hypothetical protein